MLGVIRRASGPIALSTIRGCDCREPALPDDRQGKSVQPYAAERRHPLLAVRGADRGG